MAALFWVISIIQFEAVNAQSRKGEYFFDTDPGHGSGIPFSINSSADSLVISQNIPVSGLSQGFHSLYIRLRFNGVWSHTEVSPFFILSVSPSSSAAQLSRLEYFFDSDPGVGSGTKIILSSADSAEKTVAIPISGLTAGFHNLYVRAGSGSGFGPTEVRPFFILSSSGSVSSLPVTKLEYFFDTDPGQGLGTKITLNSADSSEKTAVIPVSGLSAGFHNLYIRAGNSSGFGPTEVRPFFILSSSGSVSSPALSRLEYFFDSDPGPGLGTEISLNSADSTEKTAAIPVTGLAAGFHNLYIRAGNASGFGPTEVRPFFILSSSGSVSSLPVTKLEYFFDTDPGQGLGTKITLSSSDSSDKTAAIPVSSLSAGFHNLYIRAGNSAGFGAAEVRPLFILNSTVSISGPVKKMEFFIDTDPGPGLGTAISAFSQGDSVEITRVLSLPAGLTLGSHQLFIRAMGSDGRWSLTEVKEFTVQCGPPAVSATQTQLCPGASTILSFASGDLPGTYRWLRNNVVISGATSFSLTVTQAGNYRLIYSTGSCTDTSEVISIGNGTAITAAITASGPLSFCSGSSVNLSANSGSGLNYQWLKNGFALSGETGQNLSQVSQSGGYSVIVSNSSGCRDTSEIRTVTVSNLPNTAVSPAGPLAFCQGSNRTISLIQPQAGVNYRWKNGNALISGATGSSISVSSSGNYRLIATTEQGCTDSSSAVQVTVSDGILAVITPIGSLSICQDETVSLQANSQPGFTFQWMRNSSLISGQTSSTLQASLTGSYQVIISASAGCSDTSDVVNVQVNQKPPATLSSPGGNNLCPGNTLIMKANKGVGLSYQWLLNGSQLAGESRDSLLVAVGGNYQVRVSNSFSCSTLSPVLTINGISDQTPVIAPGGPLAFCSGDSVLLNASGSGGTLQWFRDNVLISGATGVSLKVKTAGNFRADRTVNSCVFTSNTVQVQVNTQFPPVPVIQSGGFSSVCQNETIELRSSSLTGNQWFFNGNPVPGAVLDNFTVSQAGSYRVRVSSGGCSSISLPLNLTVLPLPAVSISSSGTSICQGQTRVLSASGTGLSGFKWYSAGLQIIGESASTFTATGPGSYVVSATGTNGCTGTSPAFLLQTDAEPVLSSNLSAPSICAGTPVQLSVSAGSGFQWSTGQTGNPIQISPLQSTTVRVVSTGILGCQFTDSIRITVDPVLELGSFSTLFPANGTLNVPVSNQIFSWAPIENANQYEVFVWPAAQVRPFSGLITTGISASISGLQVFTDYQYQVIARNGCNNRESQVQTFKTKGLPDLRIISVTGPESAAPGSTISVSWTVKNVGTASTEQGSWKDYVYLTPDFDVRIGDVGPDQPLLGTFGNVSFLLPGQTYTQTKELTIPLNVTAARYFLFVSTNADDWVCSSSIIGDSCTTGRFIHSFSIPESNILNNPGYDTIQVIPLDKADLLPASMNVPAVTIGGNTINVNYLILNEGDARAEGRILGTPFSFTSVTPQGTIQVGNTCFQRIWQDNIYFSRDSIFNLSTATLLRSTLIKPRSKRTGTDFCFQPFVDGSTELINNPDWYNAADYLEPEDTLLHSETITIPHTFFGNGYVHLLVNSFNDVPEENFNKENNLSTRKISVVLRPPADIRPAGISVPSTAFSGNTLDINWVDRNIGANPPVSGESFWIDSVWLCPDAVFNRNTAIFIGSKMVSPVSDILPGTERAVSLNALLANGLAGTFFVYVKANSTGSVFEHTFTSNNLQRSQNQISISIPPTPDLQVTGISVPSSATIGNTFIINYKIKNNGPAKAEGQITDVAYFSQNGILNRGNPTGTKSHALSLNPGEEIQLLMNAIINQPGTYHFFLETNAGGSMYEHEASENNILSSQFLTSGSIIIQAVPPPPVPQFSLKPTSLQMSATASSGATFQVSWNVINQGPDAIIQSWTDGFFLSEDSVLSSGDIFLSNFSQSGLLPAGETRSRTTSFFFPEGISGNFFLLLAMDRFNQSGESNPGDNLLYKPLQISLTPPPNLVMQSATIPATAFAGDLVRVPVKIKNTGSGALRLRNGASAWFDGLHLSNLPVLGGGNSSQLQSVSRANFVINPGQEIMDTLQGRIPSSASGFYYLIAKTDNSDAVFESDESDNEKSGLIQIAVRPPANLSFGNISTPASVTAGKTASVGITLKNTGENPAVGQVKNGVFLGKTILNGGKALGTALLDINLPPGDSVNTIVAGLVPGLLPGNYKAWAQANMNNAVPESEYSDNFREGRDSISLIIPSLILNSTKSDQLSQSLDLYYKVDVAAGLDLIVTLASNISSGTNQVFVSYNRIPTVSDFEFTQENDFGTAQEVLIPSTKAGSYYLLIRTSIPGNLVQDVQILARALPFSILSSSPGKVGQGIVTTELKGAGFRDQSVVSLLDRNNGSTVATGRISDFRNSMQMKVRWDFSLAPLGRYDLKVMNPSGESKILSNCIQIDSARDYSIELESYAPSQIRRGKSGFFTFIVRNSGNLDIPVLHGDFTTFKSAQIRQVRTRGRVLKGSNWNISPEIAQSIPPRDTLVEGQMVSVPYLLRNMSPGETGEITLYINLANYPNGTLPIMSRAVAYEGVGLANKLLLPLETMRLLMLEKPESFESAAFNSLKQIAGNRKAFMDTTFLSFNRIGLLNPEDTVGLVFACESCESGGGTTYNFDEPTYSPGASPGTLDLAEAEFAGDESYLWEINDYNGTPGGSPGWDLIHISGLLQITATPTDPFVVRVSSITRDNLEGLLSGWYPAVDKCWPIVIADGGINGFDSSKFVINSIEFDSYNSRHGGKFSLFKSGDTLFLCFTARIPGIGENGIPGAPGGPGQNGSPGGPGGPGNGTIPPGNGGSGGSGGPATATQPAGNGGPGGSGGSGGPGQNGGNGGQGGAGGIGGGRGGAGGSGGSGGSNGGGGTGGNGGAGGAGGGAGGIGGSGGFNGPSGPGGGPGGNGGPGGPVLPPGTEIPVPPGTPGGPGPGGPGGPGGPSSPDEPVPGGPGGNGGGGGFGGGLPGPAGPGGSGGGGFGPGGSPGNPGGGSPGGTGPCNGSGSSASTEAECQALVDVATNALETGRKIGSSDNLAKDLLSQLFNSLGVAANTPCQKFITGTLSDAIGLVNTVAAPSGLSRALFISNALIASAQFGLGLGNCGNDLFGAVPGGSPDVQNIIDMLGCAKGGSLDEIAINAAGCFAKKTVCTPVTSPCDPNEIKGEEGFGPVRYVKAGKPLAYKISFENDSALASTSVESARILVQLEDDMNPLSFRVASFGFGAFEFDVPQNQSSFSTVVNLPDSLPYDVEFTAGVDIIRRQLFWNFQTLDAETGIPSTDGSLGFLPRNNSAGEGEGFVNFLIASNEDATTGDTLEAKAEIIFDTNDPILTNTFNNWLDAGPPVSRVFPLPAASDSVFSVRVHAEDDSLGSGVAGISLFVSENNAALTLVSGDLTSDSSITFYGKPGNRYCFVSVAVDEVGNAESGISAPSVCTNVIGRSDTIVITSPDTGQVICRNDSVSIEWISGRTGSLSIFYEVNAAAPAVLIGSNIPVSAGRFKWLPVESSSQARIFLVSGSDTIKSGLLSISAPAVPVIQLAGPDTFCLGSSVNLSVNPLPGLTYLWSNGGSGTSVQADTSGDFFVTATDANSCKSYSEPIRLTALSPISPQVSISSSSDEPVCEGTTVSFTASASGEGNNPSFEWLVNSVPVQTGSSFSSNTLNDNDTVVVRLSSSATCASPQSVISEKYIARVITAPVAEAGSDLSVCGSSGQLAATGSGIWTVLSGGATLATASQANSAVSGLSPGINLFVWTVSQTGCPDVSDTVLITSSENPVALAGEDQQACSSLAQLTASGTGQWSVLSGSGLFTDPFSGSTQVSGLAPGQNQLIWTVSGGACPPDEDTVSITRLESNLYLGPDTVLCVGEVLELTLGSEFQNIQWSDGSTGSTLVISSAGTFSVQANGAGNCLWNDSILISYTICTGLSGPAVPETFVRIIPNPFHKKFELNISGLKESRVNVRIVSMNGSRLFEQQFEAGDGLLNETIDFSNFATGLYLLEIKTDSRTSRYRIESR